jgi:hypothetical protein
MVRIAAPTESFDRPWSRQRERNLNMKFSLRFPCWSALLASACLLCLGVVPGRADVLLGPGGTTLTPGETFPGAGSLVAIQTVASSNGNPNFSARLNEAVFRENSGTLDFLFQVSNGAGGTTSIGSLSLSSFGSVATRVGFATNNPAGFALTGSQGSGSASRSPDVITFSFPGVPPDATSNTVFVRTDATVFNSLGAAVGSGSSAGSGTNLFGNVFEPGTGVAGFGGNGRGSGPGGAAPDLAPEPSSLYLAGIAVFVFACYLIGRYLGMRTAKPAIA